MGGVTEKTVLGLDLGANSVGWALVGYENGEPVQIVDMGVRIFEAGTDGDIASGRDESRAVERRGARMRRRQTKRQSTRMTELARTLQRMGLLPPGELRKGADRHAFFLELDNRLRAAFAAQGFSVDQSDGLREFPYFLRARALDAPLEPHALGRALYHLAIRRGFQSNRKSDKEEKELGIVKASISHLEQAMRDTGARTLGEYFHQIDPSLERIRKRWTARSMYKAEFEQILDAQARLGALTLSPEDRKTLEYRIFYQRPLKSQKGLVGRCELEPGKRRAPVALFPAQRFRILQKVNDLRLHYLDGTERGLTEEEKRTLAAFMDLRDEVTFAGMRKALKLPKDVDFNLERGGEKKLKGNVTNARLLKVFGDRWNTLGDTEKQAIVGEILGIEDFMALARRGLAWGLGPAEAEAFAKIHLEQGYSALSREALKKLLPLMEEGVPFKTAEDRVYGNRLLGKEARPKLDPVVVALPSIRNPVVMRTLTEMRKVVNAVIAKHGKPDEIHLELARDLKKTREARARHSRDIRGREQTRTDARENIQKKLGLQKISRQDIEKVLLAEECGWVCPYTGHSINMSSLLGEHPQFDIEHIIPFSRCLDDSFMNKTLCHHEENRLRKGNSTPWEAYGGDEKRWEEIIQRVERFKGDAARRKLERFQSRDIEDYEGFAAQQLNDTRYASKLAARYAGMLYGQDALKQVQTNSGQITALLRDALHLNGLLGGGDKKTRDDHRHHAVDALVIALTNRAAVKRLSDAAKRQKLEKGRIQGFLKNALLPWDSFPADAQSAVDSIIISHRVNHKVQGRLHEDTFYSAPRKDENGRLYHVVRKPLDGNFKPADVQSIEDPAVREAVRAHLAAHGNDPKKAFADPANAPRLSGANGPVPIHRARIRRACTTFQIGGNDYARHVTADSNHHMEIIEETRNGKTRWTGVMVDRLQAVSRKKRGEDVVQKDHGEGKKLVCTITSGDTFFLSSDGRYYIARTIWGQNVEFVSVFEARKKADIKASPGNWNVRSVNVLRDLGFVKMSVSPIGEVTPCHD